MKKPRKLVTGFCAVIFALQSGCAATPSSPQPTEQVDISKLGTIALATVQFAPATYHVEVGSTRSTRPTNSPLKELAKEVGRHPEHCLKIWEGAATGDPLLWMFWTFYCPAFAIVGAAMNAAEDAADKNPPIPTAYKGVPLSTYVNQQNEMLTHPEISGLAPQKTLQEYVTKYAAEKALPPFAVLEGQGLSALDEPPAYYSPPDQSVDTVLEVGITELFAVKSKGSESSSQFVLTGRGRLIRIRESTELVRDTTILDSFTHTFYTNSYTMDEWLADDGKLLASEIARGYQDLAETFVNKWLIHH